MPSTAQSRENFRDARDRLGRDAVEASFKGGGRFAGPLRGDRHQLDPRFATVGHDNCLTGVGQIPDLIERLRCLLLRHRSHWAKHNAGRGFRQWRCDRPKIQGEIGRSRVDLRLFCLKIGAQKMRGKGLYREGNQN